MNARFVTEDGVVVPAVTAERMREIDRIAMEETGPNLFQMMENAGRTLASQTIALLGAGWRGARVVVLAGGGGNGGGGICAARHLANRNVSVALVLSEPGRLGEVPTFQRKLFGSTRGYEIDATEVALERPDLIVDALIGYGQLSDCEDHGLRLAAIVAILKRRGLVTDAERAADGARNRSG